MSLAADDIRKSLNALMAAAESSGLMRTPKGVALESALSSASAGNWNAACAEIDKADTGDGLDGYFGFVHALAKAAAGDKTGLAASLRKLIGDEGTDYDILCLCAELALAADLPDHAITACNRALEIAPHASHALLRRGKARSALSDITGAIADFRRASLLQPTLTDAHIALADECRAANMLDSAIRHYRLALDLEPTRSDALTGLDMALMAAVPLWYPAMLNDTIRNDAFNTAILRAVTSKSHVLDIGTGTGLLALMAARAGAAHVTACERVGLLAEIARKTITDNGFAEQVTIIEKDAMELVIGEDLPRKADILTAEIVDTGLLREGVLALIAYANNSLLNEAATIIPNGATVFAMPIDCPQIANERRASEAAGFDISAFNTALPRHYLQTRLNNYDWRPLTQPAPIFTFAFTQDCTGKNEKEARLAPLSDGTAHAVALWFTLTLDDATSISTSPVEPPTHWDQAVFALNPPIELKQSEPVRLKAWHDGTTIRTALKR